MLWCVPTCDHFIAAGAILSSSPSVVKQVQCFYKSIQDQRQHEVSPSLPAISGLEAELRCYQSKAVLWMMGREGVGLVGEEGCAAREEEDRTLHVLWRRLPVDAHHQVFFNPYTTRYVAQQGIK